MENAKSSVGSCELMSGVKAESGEVLKQIVFRELAGPEEDALASQTMSVSQKISTILSNCVVEFGTQKEPTEIRKLIDKMVVTDRWLYLVKLRSLSLGSAYSFETKCPECSSSDKVTVDLNETSVKNAPAVDNPFRETILPSGTKVRWRLADGSVESKIEKMAKPDNAATIALFCRADQINDRPATLADVKQMSMKDRMAWRKAIDQEEGDFDDTFETDCPSCGHHYSGEMRLDVGFFFP
jgi:hypothetical protein